MAVLLRGSAVPTTPASSAEGIRVSTSNAQPQSSDTVLMVRPVGFGYDEETAASNAFQREIGLSAEEAAARGRAEFDSAVALLRGAGVRVLVMEDVPEPHTPDAVFPNNWFSTHADGTLVVYPMATPMRRGERRVEALRELLAAQGFGVERCVDLTARESDGVHLEGTGSLVLDHAERVAYACRSARTDAGLVRVWAERMGYRPVVFDAFDSRGVPLYHTNVLGWIGTGVAAMGIESIASADRGRVMDQLSASGRKIVALSPEQLDRFAGNALEVRRVGGPPLLALSSTAADALTGDQRRTIEAHAAMVSVPIPTIEAIGGGSLRCMLAEIFLPRAGRE
jgi:hypothetical protein